MKLEVKQENSQKLDKRTFEWYAGYMELRENSAPESKLGIPTFIEQSEIEITEITKLAEKLKWMSYFKRSYSGEMRDLGISNYDPEKSLIFLAKLANKEIGFIRITNKTNKFKDYYNGQVWSIAEVYIKPPYRGKSVCKKLMQYVLKNNHVKSILLESDRYESNKYFFNQLGFSFTVEESSGLYRCYLEEFKEAICLRYESLKNNWL